FGLVLNASGSQLYVTNNGSGTVSAVNTATMMAEGEGFVGVEPIGIALSPDETRVYVANNKSGSVSVLNAATLLPAAPDIIVGGAPYGLDVAGDGRIFVANSAIGSTSMWVIDPGSLTVSTRTVGSSPVAFGRFIHRPAFVETMLQLSVAPESVIFGSAGPLTFTATLTRKDNSAPVSGGSVAFMVDGASVGNATTNAAGAATLAYNPSALLVGTHTARAAFSESAINGLTHKASDASQAFSVRYQFTWRSPSNGGSVNTANAGSTIPLRWSMTDANGNAIANAEFSITSAPCPSAAAAGPTGKVAARFAGNSDLRYDASTNQYVFNWKTQREWAGTCRQLFVDPKDGSLHSLTFQFR
ncbi:MAG TPA: PxKF domain-containing protein, partial [bacterium]|nr:PxKF domain-containing protein [bacterium]